jgi:hypothetical protein
MKETACWRLAIYAALLQSSIAVKKALEARSGFLLVPKISKRRMRAAMNAWGPVFKIELASALAATRCEHLYRQLGEATASASSFDQIEERPMQPLQNVRQETFAQLMAAGHSATASSSTLRSATASSG